MNLADLRAHARVVVRHRRFRFAGIVIAVYAVIGFFLVPPIARSVMQKKLRAALHRQVTVGAVRVNPFTLSVTVRDFALLERDGGPFVSFGELYLNFQLQSIARRGIILRDIILRSPHLTVTRLTLDRYNFSDLIDEANATPSPPKDPNEKPLRYSFNNIQIIDGAIDFNDLPKHDKHTVTSLEVAVPFFSDLPYDADSYIVPAFHAVVNGTAFSLFGRTKPFSATRETALDLDFENLSVPKYMDYVPMALHFVVRQALVDAKLTLTFSQPAGAPPTVTLGGQLAVKDFALDNLKSAPLVGWSSLAIHIAPSEVLAQKIAFDSITLTKPVFHIERRVDGSINLAALAPQPEKISATKPPSSKAPSSPALQVKAAQLRLIDGTVTFVDDAAAKFATTLSGIDATVLHFSTLREESANLDFSFRTESAETLRVKSDFTLAPEHASGTFAINGIVLKKYAPYYAPHVLVDLDDGKFDLDTHFAVSMEDGAPRVLISDLNAGLHRLKVRRRAEKSPLFTLEELAVKKLGLDLGKRAVDVQSVTLDKGALSILRAENGALNLQALVVAEVPASPAKRAPDVDVPARKADDAAAAPWSATIDHLALANWIIKVKDKTVPDSVELSARALSVTVDHFSTAKKSRAQLAVKTRLDRTGALAVTGTFGIGPIAANVKVALHNVELPPFGPYLSQSSNLRLQSGTLSTDLGITVAALANNVLDVGYKGRARVEKLSLVDKQTGDDFLKWESLYVGDVAGRTQPASLTIGEVALASFYSKLAVEADGTLNLNKAFSVQATQAVQDEAGDTEEVAVDDAPTVPTTAAPTSAAPIVAASPPQKERASAAVKIDNVTLQDGKIDFADHSVQPNFSTSLQSVGGRLQGLTSDQSTVADVDVRAKLDDYAPLEITGKINPLAKQLAVDLKISFKDIELGPMSPYFGKYAGYNIQKGRLSLDLKYNVQQKKLVAQNAVFIDQFTLGDHVENKTQTKLPVRLAIALLRDRNGEIHIDLPIEGSLEDPKFHLGRLILQVVRNVVVKAATAPFALLGSMFGHGEALSYLEFDDGRAAIPEAANAKMGALAKALQSRPALKLEVAGHVDPERDREGLRRVLFERRVKAQKQKELGQKNADVAAVDAITLSPAEYDKYLTLAYKQETFPKPRNAIGLVKTLPSAEMEKLMLTHITVTDDDLATLCTARSREVKQWLVAQKVEPERVFVVESKTMAPQKKNKVKDSRADFSLK